MTRKNPTIIAPKAGWKAHTYYLVEVCFNPSNPCFLAIFHSGFLNGRDGGPGGYNEIGFMDQSSDIGDIVFLRVVRELVTISPTTPRPASVNWHLCPAMNADSFDLTPL